MRVIRGSALMEQFLDIADEVDLNAAEHLLKGRGYAVHSAQTSTHLRLPVAPLRIDLASTACGALGLAGATAILRIYDMGALAVIYIVPFPMLPEAQELLAFSSHLTAKTEIFASHALSMAKEILECIQGACKIPKIAETREDYIVFYVQQTEPKVEAEYVLSALDIPRLLAGETNILSTSEREHMLQARLCYSPHEMVVIDWNCAFVYSSEGSHSDIAGEDIIELLEWSAVELLELKVYNAQLEQSLNRLYGRLDSGIEMQDFFSGIVHRRRNVVKNMYDMMLGGNIGKLGLRQSTQLSHHIMRLWVEITNLSERVDNSLQLLGDTWLARVHRLAVREFDIPMVQKQLQNKLEILRKINEFLVYQITAEKSFRVEVAIVILIVVEIVLALFKH